MAGVSDVRPFLVYDVTVAGLNSGFVVLFSFGQNPAEIAADWNTFTQVEANRFYQLYHAVTFDSVATYRMFVDGRVSILFKRAFNGPN